MNYHDFRTAWHEALAEAGTQRDLFTARETVDLRDMSRVYEGYAYVAFSQETKPFSVSMRLSWEWDAMLSARAATTEEDALMMLLGDERRHEETERPSLRVDVKLSATVPWGTRLPLPAAEGWRRWVADVAERLEPLLPAEWARQDDRVRVFAGRSEPEARVEPAASGTLHLKGVSVGAWELIELPRQWDDPERERDEDPYEQLVDFVERVWEAMEGWNRSLAHLLPPSPLDLAGSDRE